jgi:ERCC4-type nuclease
LFESNLSMIVSNRHKGKPVASELEKLGITLRYANLKAGDFLISGKMAVEIETAEGFLDSISTKMLFRKLIDFRRDFPEAIFIIEGFNNQNGKMTSTKVRSAISYITVLNRMPIIITKDAKDTAEYLNLLARQAQHGLTHDPESERKKERYGSAKEAQLAIAEALPDVGPAIAESILIHFGSLSRLFKASVSDLMKVGGVGRKKAEKIHRFIESRFRK